MAVVVAFVNDCVGWSDDMPPRPIDAPPVISPGGEAVRERWPELMDRLASALSGPKPQYGFVSFYAAWQHFAEGRPISELGALPLWTLLSVSRSTLLPRPAVIDEFVAKYGIAIDEQVQRLALNRHWPLALVLSKYLPLPAPELKAMLADPEFGPLDRVRLLRSMPGHFFANGHFDDVLRAVLWERQRPLRDWHTWTAREVVRRRNMAVTRTRKKKAGFQGRIALFKELINAIADWQCWSPSPRFLTQLCNAGRCNDLIAPLIDADIIKRDRRLQRVLFDYYNSSIRDTTGFYDRSFERMLKEKYGIAPRQMFDAGAWQMPLPPPIAPPQAQREAAAADCRPCLPICQLLAWPTLIAM